MIKAGTAILIIETTSAMVIIIWIKVTIATVGKKIIINRSGNGYEAHLNTDKDSH